MARKKRKNRTAPQIKDEKHGLAGEGKYNRHATQGGSRGGESDDDGHWRRARGGKRKGRKRGDELALDEEEYHVLKEQLREIGLKICDVFGDGNCLFRAVADQMVGNEERHSEFREASVRFMLQNDDHFAPFLADCTLEDYCKKMMRQGRWGGNLELQAISMYFDVDIVIHRANAPAFVIKASETSSRTIHLAYHFGEHYNSVRPISERKDHDDRLTADSMLTMMVDNSNGTSGENREPNKMETIIMQSTGCTDLVHIRKTLNDHWHDMNAAIEAIVEQMYRDEKTNDSQKDNADNVHQSQNLSTDSIHVPTVDDEGFRKPLSKKERRRQKKLQRKQKTNLESHEQPPPNKADTLFAIRI